MRSGVSRLSDVNDSLVSALGALQEMINVNHNEVVLEIKWNVFAPTANHVHNTHIS